MSENKTYTYNAFISYRHTQPDKEVAERLHKLLETYRVPKTISKIIGKKKIDRVFRDRDELPTSSNLANNITAALENSEYLIVICSPRTSQSQWVLKEIETFSKFHGHDRILALLIEGEPEEAFPQQLRFLKQQVTNPDGTVSEAIMEVEPLAADIRASNTKEMLKNLKKEVLRLLAPMLGCRYDDLKQRHRDRLIKNILTASISLSAFFLAFGSFSTYQALIINQKSQEVAKQIKQTQMTQSLYLSDVSKRLLEEGDRHRAILVALEALPKHLEEPDRPYVHEAEMALSQALRVYDVDTYFDPDRVLDHDKPILFMKLSPDKKTLLTACWDGTFHTWNMEDAAPISSFDINGGFPSQENTYFLDGHVITKGNDGRLICFNLQGIKVWESKDSYYVSAISPDNKFLATTHWKNLLILLDTQTGAIAHEIDFADFLNVKDTDEVVTTLAFNKDGTKVGIGSSSGHVIVVDLASQSITPYTTVYEHVDEILFTDDNEIMMASNEYDLSTLFNNAQGILQKFSLNNPDALQAWHFPSSSVTDLKLNPANSSQLLFVENSDTIHVLDLDSGEILYTCPHGDRISHYQINDTVLISASDDGTIRFYVMYGDTIIENGNYRITRPSSINQFILANGIMAFHYTNGNKVYLYKVLSNENTLRLEGHSNYISKGAFSPDGSLVMTVSYSGGEVVLWDAQSKQLLRSVSLNENITEAVFTPDGSHIAVLLNYEKALLLRTSDLSIEKEVTGEHLRFYAPFLRFVVPENDTGGYQYALYDMETFNKISTWEDLSSDVLFLPDGQIIQYESYEDRLTLHDAEGNQISALEEIEINTQALNDDGTLLAVALKDKTIRLYTMDSGFQEQLTLTDLKYPATKILFSPDAKLLYIGLDDKSLAIYFTDDGRLLGTLALDDELDRIIYGADGQQILIIPKTGDSQLWDLPAFKPLATIDRVIDIDKEFKTILSNWIAETIFMPLYDTQMLLDEARKQLNGRVLTEKERKTLFIEP